MKDLKTPIWFLHKQQNKEMLYSFVDTENLVNSYQELASIFNVYMYFLPILLFLK